MFDQSRERMLLSRIYSGLQSSYRAGHRTETALLEVVNGIMLSMNSKCHASCIIRT